MLKDYYYTDKEELDALRVENQKLKDRLAQLEAKYKRGGRDHGIKEN